MPQDPELVAEAKAWLAKASEDLRAAKVELAADPPLLGHTVFHAQQAAEKAMKGFLTWHQTAFRKTHNLIEVGGACHAIDSTLEPVLRRAAMLTDYAWKYRYPGEPFQPTKNDAKSALRLSREVYEAIVSRLPAPVRP